MRRDVPVPEARQLEMCEAIAFRALVYLQTNEESQWKIAEKHVMTRRPGGEGDVSEFEKI